MMTEQLFTYKLGGWKSSPSSELPTHFQHLDRMGEPVKCENKFHILPSQNIPRWAKVIYET